MNDISALVLLFPPQEGVPHWCVLPWFWCPLDDIDQRSTEGRVPYRAWVEEGLIEATPGNVTDYRFIEARVLELAGQYDLQSLAFDRTFSGAIIQNLEAEGIDCVQFGQGFMSMSSPAKELERMVLGRELEHFGNRVLSWMAGNCVVSRDPAGNIKPDKAKSGGKIDGIAALIMALGLAQAEEEQPVIDDITVWG